MSKKIQIYLLLGIALSFCLPAFAGGPYAGGSGDGFAQAMLEWQALGTYNDAYTSLPVYPSPARPGQAVSNGQAGWSGQAEMTGLDGTHYGFLRPLEPGRWELPDVPAGVYIIHWRRDGGNASYSRLVIASF